MGDRGRLWALLACLASTVLILSLAILPSRSSSGALGATTNHATNASGVACGSIGPAPTRAEVEQFAAKQQLSATETANLLDCFGFATGSD